MNPLNAALIFATQAHGDQCRKYSGEPYVAHLIEVMMLVREHGGTEAMQVAALLHDVVEDTDTDISVITGLFGKYVAHMVWALTDREEGNRATRKRLSCERLAAASAEVQTIKLADLISNTRSIVRRDPDFARLYLREKAALLRVLERGDRRLWKMAADLIPHDYWRD